MTRYLPFRIGAFVSLILAAATLLPAAHAEEWKFALEEVTGSVQDAYAQKFKELVEQKTGGDVTVTVYPYGALGDSQQITELVATGAIQIGNASPGHLGTLVPEIQVFSIPYLLSENNQVNKEVLTTSETIYGTLAADFEAKELKLLTMYPEGEMVWTTNKPIRSPEDFNNFKMRTMTSPMLTTAYKAFGANPTPLPYSEVYGALQLKMVDGQVNPIFAIEEMKFYEVTDYMIFSGEQQFTTTVVGNYEWYEGLADDQKQMLAEVLSEAAGHIFEVQEQYNTERLEKIKEKKPDLEIIELTEEERSVFRERAAAVRQQYIEMVGPRGQEILDALVSEIEAAEKEKGAGS